MKSGTALRLCIGCLAVCVGSLVVIAQNHTPGGGEGKTMPNCGKTPEDCAGKSGKTAQYACCNAQCTGNDALDCQDVCDGGAAS